MPGTTSKYGLAKPSGGDEIRTIDATVGSAMDDIDDLIATADKGTLASRPTSTSGTPGKSGRLYYATDTGQLFFDHGTGWLTLHHLSTTPPAARVVEPRSTWSFPTGQLIRVPWSTEDFQDQTGMWTAPPGAEPTDADKLVAVTAGIYIVTATIQWDDADAGNRRIELRHYNSANVLQAIVGKVEHHAAADTVAATVQNAHGIARAGAGDYFSVWAQQDSGVTIWLDDDPDVESLSSFSIARIGA